MRPLVRTGSLVGRPVVIGDVRLGVVVDVLLDRTLSRLVGLDVRSGDEARRFLPFPACSLGDDRLAVETALVLLERELDFYRAGGNAFSEIRGKPVAVGGKAAGTLADLLVDDEGAVDGIVVDTPQGEAEVEPGAGVAVGNHALRSAV